MAEVISEEKDLNGFICKCIVCGKTDVIAGADFICEDCGKPGMTAVYCENCKYVYLPPDVFFESDLRKQLKKDGLPINEAADCAGLVIRFNGGCPDCSPQKWEGITLFRIRI